MPELKESRQELWRKGKGNLSAVRGSKESAVNGKQRNSAQEETHVVFTTMRTNVESQRAHHLLLQNRRRKAMGKTFEKDSLSEVGVRLGRDLEDRAKTASVGNARTSRVSFGILPCVRSTKLNRDANSVKSALL